MLIASGWLVQSKNQLNLTAGCRATIHEYHTNIGPAGYILFENMKPVGVIEAKREEVTICLPKTANISYRLLSEH
jgi:type I restriction enzyme R subunit